MAACMTLPCLSFVYLAVVQPTSLVTISICIAIEQFGYGFGFTAYMLYMMYFSEGQFKTSHYAFCTCFMALSMMIPGMFAGYLQESFGYKGFFWMVIFCCVATVLVTLMADRKVDPEYGMKKTTD
jgi:PAT family beta-lactamase induction signal transducer AmpG